jgi:hypothetical protein
MTGRSSSSHEQTEWIDVYDKKKVNRSILIEAESAPGEWKVGA